MRPIVFGVGRGVSPQITGSHDHRDERIPMIIDGAAIVGPGVAPDPRDYLLACYPEAQIAPLDHVVGTAEPLVPRVNHGTWVASCSCGARGIPTPGMVVFLDVPWGWCVRCGNRPWGGGWRRIVAPSLDERRRIERVLLLRPNVEDRNWEPGETVADLIAQNAEHGDPIPPLDEPPPLADVPSGPRPSRFPSPSAMAAVLSRFRRRRR